MVNTASQTAIASHVSYNPGKAVRKTRRNAAKAAAFTAAAMNPVTGAGAPSYASGVHMWNGTAATLKPKPTASMATPITSMGLAPMPSTPTESPISDRFVAPVAPNTRATPRRKKALENAPSRKYLSAPSADRASLRFTPVRTYTGTDISSRPMKISMRSALPANTIMPTVAKSTSTYSSPSRICSSSR